MTPDFVAKCSNVGKKGDGLLHFALFRGRFVYVPECRQWYEWAGQKWQEVHIHKVEASVDKVSLKYREIASHYERLARQAKDAGDKEEGERLKAAAEKMFGRASYLNSSRGVNACIKFTLTNSDPLICRPDIWDKDPWLLGVANGGVDLRTGEFRPGRPDDFMKKPVLSNGKA